MPKEHLARWIPERGEITRQGKILALITGPIIRQVGERYRRGPLGLAEIFNQPETRATVNLLQLQFLLKEDRYLPQVIIKGIDLHKHTLEYFVIVNGGIPGNWRDNFMDEVRQFVYDPANFEPTGLEESFTREFMGVTEGQNFWRRVDFDKKGNYLDYGFLTEPASFVDW